MTERLQIIWTPWRNHRELLNVRERFFPASASCEQTDPNSRRKACDQVSAWKLRGNLPHAVESTWLLTEAILIDEQPIEHMPVFAIKASYITAISRSSFVTGLLDSQQESKYKVSMYIQAQKIGLPALFVDIRHEATHGDMPNLKNLRSAAERALKWLWDDYWKDLERETVSAGSMAEQEGEGVKGDLGGNDDEEQPGGWQRWQGRWTPKPIGTV